MLPFGADVAVPLMNLAWLALALGAAWAIGAVTGRASVGAALAAVVLALPLLAATQGGTGRVDVATIALVLSTVAVLVARPLTTGSAAVAGLALGLAVGAKFALLPLAGVMLVAVAAVLWRRRSWPPAAAWTAGVALTAGYWYVRNWWVTGSPVPAIDLRFGPVGFAPLPEDRLALLEDTSIVDHLDRPGLLGQHRPAGRRAVHRDPAGGDRTGRRRTRRRRAGGPAASARGAACGGRGRGRRVRRLPVRAVQRPHRRPSHDQPDRRADRGPQRPLPAAATGRPPVPAADRAGGPVTTDRRRRRRGGGGDDGAAVAAQPVVRRGVADHDRRRRPRNRGRPRGGGRHRRAAGAHPPRRHVATVGDERGRRGRRGHRGGALAAGRWGGREPAQLRRHAVRPRGPVARHRRVRRRARGPAGRLAAVPPHGGRAGDRGRLRGPAAGPGPDRAAERLRRARRGAGGRGPTPRSSSSRGPTPTGRPRCATSSAYASEQGRPFSSTTGPARSSLSEQRSAAAGRRRHPSVGVGRGSATHLGERLLCRPQVGHARLDRQPGDVERGDLPAGALHEAGPRPVAGGRALDPVGRGVGLESQLGQAFVDRAGDAAGLRAAPRDRRRRRAAWACRW